jgi:GNAT superfamily N-acetyltransferase
MDAVADDIRISDDPAELDRDRVFQWISGESYWAKGVSREKQERAIDNSWCFGAYDAASGEQLGIARVVTDRATFAWLCDVFVDESARGRGVGKKLMAAIVAALEPLGLRRMLLATADAHGLYAQYGFEPMTSPERWMVRPGVPGTPAG